jgi:hypothetical protein
MPRNILSLFVLLFPSVAVAQDPRGLTHVLRITGENGGDLFGWSISRAGDVNHDGKMDLLIVAPAYDVRFGFAGRTYLFLGPFAESLSASDAAAVFDAQAFGDNLGVAVSSAGDVDGDGFADFAMGARGQDGAGIQAGRVYVFHGPIHGAHDATEADAIISGVEFEELGWSLAGGADLNGDGRPDLVIGAPQSSTAHGGLSAGRAYVFHGSITGALSSQSADAILEGERFNDMLGESLAIGDFDGDGSPDVIVGAPHPPLEFNDTGVAYVFRGPLAGRIDASRADALLKGELENDEFGTSVANAGDVNGDGIDDVIVGAHQLFRPGAGKAYVFHGPLSGTRLAKNADLVLDGEHDGDLFGGAVASAGDVNGDGLADVMAGALEFGNRRGRAYLFLSPRSGHASAASADLVFTGKTSGDRLGQTLAPAGDLDGNHRDDLLIGATQFADTDPGFVLIALMPALRTTTLTPRSTR